MPMRLQADDWNLQDRDGDASMVSDSPKKGVPSWRVPVVFWGNIGIMEDKMETIIWVPMFSWGKTWIMENKTETTIWVPSWGSL